MTYPPPPEQPEFGQPSQAVPPPEQAGQPPYQAAQQPYQYAPPPPAGYPGYPGAQPAKLRGRMPLRLALIFGVIGLAMTIAGGVVIAKKSFGKVDNFDRVGVGATGKVTFDKTGNYLAYYEGDEVDDNISKVPLSAITLTSPSGRSMRLETLYGGRKDNTIDTKLTYDYHGHKGVAIYQYKIKEKGTYQVSIQPTGGESTGSDYAFGKSIGGALALGVALIIPGVLFIVTAIILLIVGLVKRSRHKKQLQAGPFGAPPPGYGYPQQGWTAPTG